MGIKSTKATKVSPKLRLPDENEKAQALSVIATEHLLSDAIISIAESSTTGVKVYATNNSVLKSFIDKAIVDYQTSLDSSKGARWVK